MKRLTEEERKERKKEQNKRFAKFLKEKAKREDDYYFGADNKRMKSNKYYTIKHVINDDEIILNTMNIEIINQKIVMALSHHYGLYLKDFQVRKVHNFADICSNFYLVKLKRSYFKPYFFKKSMFENLIFTKNSDSSDLLEFDSYLKIAKSQDENGMILADGHMNI